MIFLLEIIDHEVVVDSPAVKIKGLCLDLRLNDKVNRANKIEESLTSLEGCSVDPVLSLLFHLANLKNVADVPEVDPTHPFPSVLKQKCQSKKMTTSEVIPYSKDSVNIPLLGEIEPVGQNVKPYQLIEIKTFEKSPGTGLKFFNCKLILTL